VVQFTLYLKVKYNTGSSGSSVPQAKKAKKG